MLAFNSGTSSTAGKNADKPMGQLQKSTTAIRAPSPVCKKISNLIIQIIDPMCKQFLAQLHRDVACATLNTSRHVCSTDGLSKLLK